MPDEVGTASIAQSVERNHGKVEVISSILIGGSILLVGENNGKKSKNCG